MEKHLCKPSGTKPNRLRFNAAPMRTLLPCVALASLLLLPACATTTTATTDTAAQCAAWRAITYSLKHDTKATVEQIRIHNETGHRLGCW